MKRLYQVLNFVFIAYGGVRMLVAPELRLYWAVALAALALTQITLWTALFLTGQHKQLRSNPQSANASNGTALSKTS